MRNIQLVPGQSVDVMPKLYVAPAEAILSTLKFVRENSLAYADLHYYGYNMGVYPDSNPAQLLAEYKWWKENPQKRIDK